MIPVRVMVRRDETTVVQSTGLTQDLAEALAEMLRGKPRIFHAAWAEPDWAAADVQPRVASKAAA